VPSWFSEQFITLVGALFGIVLFFIAAWLVGAAGYTFRNGVRSAWNGKWKSALLSLSYAVPMTGGIIFGWLELRWHVRGEALWWTGLAAAGAWALGAMGVFLVPGPDGDD
jgi:hypothetical protein